MRAFILDSNQENFISVFSHGPASKFISYQSRKAQSLARWSMLTKKIALQSDLQFMVAADQHLVHSLCLSDAFSI